MITRVDHPDHRHKPDHNTAAADILIMMRATAAVFLCDKAGAYTHAVMRAYPAEKSHQMIVWSSGM